jgi:hypothetical protein
VPDLIVESKVIVDPKVVDCLHERHIAQMLGIWRSLDLSWLFY